MNNVLNPHQYREYSSLGFQLDPEVSTVTLASMSGKFNSYTGANSRQLRPPGDRKSAAADWFCCVCVNLLVCP